MARSKRDSLERDAQRLDSAIDAVLEVMLLPAPEETGRMPEDKADIERSKAAFLAKMRFDGAKALVPLLERRAKLLGLDLERTNQPSGEESVIDRMNREIREQGGAPKVS